MGPWPAADPGAHGVRRGEERTRGNGRPDASPNLERERLMNELARRARRGRAAGHPLPGPRSWRGRPLQCAGGLRSDRQCHGAGGAPARRGSQRYHVSRQRRCRPPAPARGAAASSAAAAVPRGASRIPRSQDPRFHGSAEGDPSGSPTRRRAGAMRRRATRRSRLIERHHRPPARGWFSRWAGRTG